MMRFEKGSRVEVLSRNGESFGAWRCAEILSGDGDSFSVAFDYSQVNNGDLVAEVSREVIRPCPPLDFVSSISWSSGDLVEVFDDHCWKTAVVLKVLFPNCYYLVKLIGSSKELRLRKVDIRLRQLWQDGEWIVIGKRSQHAKELKTKRVTDLSSNPRARNPMVNNYPAEENNTGFQDSCVLTDRTRKRASPFCSSNGQTSKIRAVEKKGELREVKSGCSVLSRILAPNESGNDECSVGSCSVISNSQSKPFTRANRVSNSCDEDSDAESFYGSRDERRELCPSVGVNVAVRIHNLELQAYRRTLEAFYASGSLSWEQELLLTNLRMSLNISNDEHLLELRKLISPGASVHVR